MTNTPVPQEEWYAQHNQELGQCAANEEGKDCCLAKPEVMEPILREQRKRDLEEFREMVEQQFGEKWAGKSVAESHLLGEVNAKLSEIKT